MGEEQQQGRTQRKICLDVNVEHTSYTVTVEKRVCWALELHYHKSTWDILSLLKNVYDGTRAALSLFKNGDIQVSLLLFKNDDTRATLSPLKNLHDGTQATLSLLKNMYYDTQATLSLLKNVYDGTQATLSLLKSVYDGTQVTLSLLLKNDDNLARL